MKVRGFILNLRIGRPDAAQAVGAHSRIASLARRVQFEQADGYESVPLTAQAKAPGEVMIGEDVRLVEHRCPGDEMEPYERLPGDALRGDRTMFGSQAGVEAAWRVVDPILKGDEAVLEYDCGSWGPAEAGRLAANAGGWLEPSVVERSREPETVRVK